MLSIQYVLMGGIIAVVNLTCVPGYIAATFRLPAASQISQFSPRLAQQPDLTSTHTSAAAAIDSFMQTFNKRRSRKPGLSRSGGFCPIAPGLIETDKVWSDRPLFLWQGNIGQIQLRKLGDRDVLWSQTIAPGHHSITYSGAALEPGQVYQWELLGQNDFNASFVFQVLAADQRSPIAAQLQTIVTRLKASGATPETILIQQAQYFAEQNLWSDALQLLYAIDHPSAATVQTIHQIEASLCSGQAT